MAEPYSLRQDLTQTLAHNLALIAKSRILIASSERMHANGRAAHMRCRETMAQSRRRVRGRANAAV
jgi:hypothetical protein